MNSTDKLGDQENPCSEQFRFLLLRSFHLITLTSECHPMQRPRKSERVERVRTVRPLRDSRTKKKEKPTTTPAPAREEIA